MAPSEEYICVVTCMGSPIADTGGSKCRKTAEMKTIVALFVSTMFKNLDRLPKRALLDEWMELDCDIFLT